MTEEDQLAFIKAFREVMRYNAPLQTFVEYDQDETNLDKQHFANFASKYADLCRDLRKTTTKEKVSVLDDVDFQLDLLHSERINVGYILNLLRLAIDAGDAEKEQAYQHICEAENLKPEVMQQVLDHYKFTKRLPRKEELKDLPNYKVKLFERDNEFSKLLVKTRQLIEKFYIGFKS